MKTLIALGISLLWFTAAHAQIYKWTDENGVTHWTDHPPPEVTDVETRSEIKSNPINDLKKKHPKKGKRIDKALGAYRGDLMDSEVSLQKKKNKSASHTKEYYQKMQNHHEKRAAEYQQKIKDHESDLNKVRNQSYTNTRSHDQRLENYRRRIRDAKIKLKEHQDQAIEYKIKKNSR